MLSPYMKKTIVQVLFVEKIIISKISCPYIFTSISRFRFTDLFVFLDYYSFINVLKLVIVTIPTLFLTKLFSLLL